MNCYRFNFQTAKDDPVVTVIASEAKQSINRKESMDCFVASLLAMTVPQVQKRLRPRGAKRPRR
jgi:hypothetical protein